MFNLSFFILAAAVVAVLASFGFLYLYRSPGDRSRLPERTIWYVGVATLVFFILVFGQRAEEPAQNLQMVLGAFVVLSVFLAAGHTWRALGNLLRHMAKEEARSLKSTHHRHEHVSHAG